MVGGVLTIPPDQVVNCTSLLITLVDGQDYTAIVDVVSNTDDTFILFGGSSFATIPAGFSGLFTVTVTNVPVTAQGIGFSTFAGGGSNFVANSLSFTESLPAPMADSEINLINCLDVS